MKVRTAWGIAAMASALAWPLAAAADIVALKDGSVIECIVKQNTMKNAQPVLVVELEDGSTKDVPQADVAWMAKGKPSWILRKESLVWYEKESAKLEEKGEKVKHSDHERVGRECRRRKLDEQADKHFTKSYELKVADAKDTIASHESIARWLERTCGLFDLASVEWKWVLDKKMEEYAEKGKEKPADYYKLGQYAEKVALYDEADELYKKALLIDPTYKQAAAGVERIRMLRDTLVNTKLFRTVRDQSLQTIAYFEGKNNSDGSYGADAPEGGVQGHRAMTAICAMGVIVGWEFESVEKPEASKKVPANLEKALKFLLAAPVDQKKLKGPDVWGNVWSLHLFARVLDKQQLKSYHDQVKTKAGEVFGALAKMMAPVGGWNYYDFARNSPCSFVTGTAILAMLDLKELGVNVPEDMYGRCVDAMKQMKQSDGVWMYRTGASQKVEGSQGRASLCETVLYATGNGSTAAITIAIENFFKYRHILEAVKGRAATHIGGGGTAPYYYLFGHLWTARACQKLEATMRDTYAARLRDLFLKDQESDGAFSDFPMLKETYKTYGSAMGALTLYYLGTLEKDRSKGQRR